MDLKTTLERLYSLAPRGRQLGLENIEDACDAFGNPESDFEVVHIAGTNGKGTVGAFVTSMAIADGRKIGFYSSPHLHRFAERINVGGKPVGDELLVRTLNRVMDGAPELSFFEVATLAAFLIFSESGVELAVVETGLGGRLDATNVIPSPRIAAITRISFDHTEELGDSLAAIAHEKAGIIKPGCSVVLGKLHPDAAAVIRDRIRETGALPIPLGCPEPTPGASLAYPRMAMIGSNLAVATTIARELGLSVAAMNEGIEKAVWPGRHELLHREGLELTLLDCAHNPDGSVSLVHNLDPSLTESRRQVALVFGAVHTKNWKAMLRRLEPVAGHRFYVTAPINKAVEPALFTQELSGVVAPNIATALEQARQTVGAKGLILVTGSSFVVGAARATLLGLESDPAVDL